MSPEEITRAYAKSLKISRKDLKKAENLAISYRMVGNNRHEEIITAWNKVARTELDKLLDARPDRKNVLVVAGIAHLPAFSDKYSFIG